MGAATPFAAAGEDFSDQVQVQHNEHPVPYEVVSGQEELEGQEGQSDDEDGMYAELEDGWEAEREQAPAYEADVEDLPLDIPGKSLCSIYQSISRHKFYKETSLSLGISWTKILHPAPRSRKISCLP